MSEEISVREEGASEGGQRKLSHDDEAPKLVPA